MNNEIYKLDIAMAYEKGKKAGYKEGMKDAYNIIKSCDFKKEAKK